MRLQSRRGYGTAAVDCVLPAERVERGSHGPWPGGQESAVEGYRASVNGIIIKAYKEIESGKRADRPEIIKALAHGRRTGATVVIAKLDRLSRNVAFTANLMEAGADFVACDNPNANRLTIHILAAVAEDEARRISQRTKDALKAYKERGGKLGAAREPGGVRKDGVPKLPPTPLTPEMAAHGRIKAARVRARRAVEAVADLAEQIRELRAGGASLRDIAAALNNEGHTTRRGKRWRPIGVKRVLDRSPK